MFRKEFFSYSTGNVSHANGATVVSTIRVGDQDFEVKKFTGACATTAVGVTVKITITTKNKDITSVAVPYADLVGTAQLPSKVENLVFERNANVDVSIYNGSGGLQNISLTFIGNKLYNV